MSLDGSVIAVARIPFLEQLHPTSSSIYQMRGFVLMNWGYSDLPTWVCVSSAELTHEFLQILEKTPSRLKRIRNWRVRNLDTVIPLGITMQDSEGGSCVWN